MGQLNQRSYFVEVEEILSTRPTPRGYLGISPSIKLKTGDGEVIEIPVPEDKIGIVVGELVKKTDRTEFHHLHHYKL